MYNKMIEAMKECYESSMNGANDVECAYFNKGIDKCIEIVKEYKPRIVPPSLPDMYGRMYCVQCGEAVTKTHNYCGRCGQQLREKQSYYDVLYIDRSRV